MSEKSLGARSLRVVCLCLISVSVPATLRGQVSDAAPSGVIVGDQSLEIPFVIAARGASAYLPEHTLEATVLAHAMRADYIGLGCVLTRDGVPVVLQDLILDNVSSVATDFPGRQRENGHWYVMDFSLDELRTLSIHEPTADGKTREQADSRFPQGSSRFRISTLEEHVQLVRGLNRTTGRRAGLYL
ncbi:MAG: glycerophosphodiester phosphodiesterase family protein, partial [Planctomycetaceae bacterium]